MAGFHRRCNGQYRYGGAAPRFEALKFVARNTAGQGLGMAL
ncbi:MAG: hypothetical protein ACPGQR_02050 [Marinirhabdus sp.]